MSAERETLGAAPRWFGNADVTRARATAEEALREYAHALHFWNAPDDEHSRILIRNLAEDVIDNQFGEPRSSFGGTP